MTPSVAQLARVSPCEGEDAGSTPVGRIMNEFKRNMDPYAGKKGILGRKVIRRARYKLRTQLRKIFAGIV